MKHQKFLLKKKKSSTKTQIQESITNIFESVAVFLVAGCLVAVVIFWLF
jgi:ribosomal protein L23